MASLPYPPKVPYPGCIVWFHDTGGPYAATVTSFPGEHGQVDLFVLGKRGVTNHHSNVPKSSSSTPMRDRKSLPIAFMSWSFISE